MTIREVESLLSKLKVHYPFFHDTKEAIREYYEGLKDYETSSVFEALENHLTGENGDKFCNLGFFLRSANKIITNTTDFNNLVVDCNLCKEPLKFIDYEKHYSLCLIKSSFINLIKQKHNQEIEFSELKNKTLNEMEKLINKYK